MNRNIIKYENKETVQKIVQLGRAFCIIGTAIPVCILLLRFIDYDFLMKISPGDFVMNPLTSICFIFLGISIWLSRTEETNQKHISIIRLVCFIVLCYCTSILVLTYILNINYEPDKAVVDALFKNPNYSGLNLNFKSIAINTTLGLYLLSISIIYMERRSTKLYLSPETLNYLLIWGAFLIIYGYLYSIEDLYHSFEGIPGGFYSAVTLLLLSTSVLLLRPYKGTMRYLIGENPADVFMMRFMAFFVPLIIGFVKIQGEKYNFYNDAVGTALLAISTYIISMTLLGWKSTVQYKLKIAERQKNDIIKKDREKMEIVLNNSQTYIQIIDIVNDNIIFSNESGKGSFKIGKEIENRRHSEIIKKIIHPDDIPMYMKGIKRTTALKDDEYNDMVFRVIDRKNNSIWLFSRTSVYKRENGKAIQIMYNSIDITKEKLEEEELDIKKLDLEKTKTELEEVKEELKQANEYLEKEVKRHAENLYKSEKKYHSYIRNSFAGIIQYKYIGDDIDTRLPIKEQIQLFKERIVIQEVNKVVADIHGFRDPKDMEGIKLLNFLKMPEEEIDAFIEEFIKYDYRLFNKESIQLMENDESVKVHINVFGIIKDNRFIEGWEVQTLAK